MRALDRNGGGACRRLALLALGVLAVACSGGASDGPSAPTAASESEVEFQSFQLVNSARRENGVQPQLVFDQLTSSVARAHSEAMRDSGFFGHDGPDGSLSQRLRAAGVSYSAAGENVAKVVSRPDPAASAHAEFLASPVHRGNILSGEWRLAGVGVARSGDSYWLTQIFIRD